MYSDAEIKKSTESCLAKARELRPFLNSRGLKASIMAGFMLGLIVRFYRRHGQSKQKLLAVIETAWGNSDDPNSSEFMRPGDDV